MLVVVTDKDINTGGDFVYIGDALTLLHCDQRYNPLTNRTS
jgi:hypothetical protein